MNVKIRSNRGAPWSQEDLEQLAALIAQRKTIAEIANAMGRTQEGVRGKAQLLGLLNSRRRGSRTTQREQLSSDLG